MEEMLPTIPRDISWLSFNYRVLQEAKDPTMPLFERLKFLAIYSSNLDEFFRVRVAHHRSLMRIGKKTQRQLEVSPKQVIKHIATVVNAQQEEFSDIFENQIVPELRRHRIRLLRRLDLSREQKAFVERYFHEHLLPFVQPVLLVRGKIRPFLNNAALYLSIHLRAKDKPNGPSEYAIVKMPSDYFPRFIELPSTEGWHDIIMLDDVVRNSVSWLFPGYDIMDTYSCKLTRDAELYIEDEFSGDLVDKIRGSLVKRNVGPPSRFVYDREMPPELLAFLMECFELEKADLLREGRYHNNFDFFKFPDFKMEHLKNKPMPPLHYPPLEQADDFFVAMREREHLLHYPYQSYEAVIRFFEEAAKDPLVTHIKIVQYRVAQHSRIMSALLQAVKSGKQVTAFVEVKARFDEQANLEWGERLQKAGVNVIYSFPGLKVHAKLSLVIRKEGQDEPQMYAYLSTGNFHENTARVYSDFGFFTTDQRLCREVARVFSFLETTQLPTTDFEHLLVGQFNLREGLTQRIDREIRHARNGLPARMILKMNSLEDPSMIEKLYEANEAGVRIDLIIRGICCLVPDLPAHKKNIHAISIVDRYLEHSRVFWFYNKGEEELFLSSADFMRRNLTYRIETAFPIYDEGFKAEIRDFLLLQLADNTKARILDKDLRNRYNRTDSDLSVRSQSDTYHLLKRKGELLLQTQTDAAAENLG